MPEPLTSESLAELLKAFSSNEDKAAFAYTKLRDSLVRYFQLKGISEADEAADETLDRLAEKIKQGVKIDNPSGFAFGIAKFIFLEKIRAAQTHLRAVDSFSVKTEADSDLGNTDHLEPLRK